MGNNKQIFKIAFAKSELPPSPQMRAIFIRGRNILFRISYNFYLTNFFIRVTLPESGYVELLHLDL